VQAPTLILPPPAVEALVVVGAAEVDEAVGLKARLGAGLVGVLQAPRQVAEVPLW
jgi:hypothetical protein